MLYQFSKGTALCTQNKQDNYKLIKYDDGYQNKKCRSSRKISELTVILPIGQIYKYQYLIQLYKLVKIFSFD